MCHPEQCEPLGRRPRRQPKGLKSRISRSLTFFYQHDNTEFRHVFCTCFARACNWDANTRQSRHTRVKQCVLLFKFMFKFMLTKKILRVRQKSLRERILCKSLILWETNFPRGRQQERSDLQETRLNCFSLRPANFVSRLNSC